MTTFEPDYRPIPIFSGLWTVLVFVAMTMTAVRNDRSLTGLLLEDFGEVLVYIAMGVVASVAAVLWGWRRVHVTDEEVIVEKLSTRLTGKKQTIRRDSIQQVATKYQAAARRQVVILTMKDGTKTTIPHSNLRRSRELVALLKGTERKNQQ